jgi:cyclic-di-AMP phosphodiesterase PgpH
VLGGLVGVVSYALLLLLNGSTLTIASLSNLLLVLSGNVLAGILALGLLPLAESGFDFLTEFRLVELSNPSSPLLQKLLLEAPGTYQHSLIISNLVEQAVSAIGGNSLLARVGCLYHDVGKLKRPQFYIENQIGNENPHNSISPHLSYLIITSHVKDGIELLREYKLPKALEPFVSEHHGTTVLSYFYKRALEDSARLDELNFRYPGPRPQSKETAVLMLADAVESASRTLTDPSQGSIRALIDRLISLRQQDGQLADSPLNFRDLETIANTFERMLTAILHRRIQYPSEEPKQYGGDSRRNQPLSVN